jgi:hypothetical protein
VVIILDGSTMSHCQTLDVVERDIRRERSTYRSCPLGDMERRRES